MPVSQEAIDARIAMLQEAIDLRNPGDLFELKELFGEQDWLDATDNHRLAKSLTACFKRRIVGWPGSEDPQITNVQVGGVRQNGRERMFERKTGPHQK